MPRKPYDWKKAIIRRPDAPATAIKILYATQALDLLITKIRDYYFPAGVQSARLIAPAVKSLHFFLPGQPVKVFPTGILRDPASGVELEIDRLLRQSN